MKTPAILFTLIILVLWLSGPVLSGPPEPSDQIRLNGYLLYPDFSFVTLQEYACYGLPQGQYQFHKCSHCGHWYVSQPFGHNEKTECTLYADAVCEIINGKRIYHEGLDLEPVSWCPCITVTNLNNIKP